MSRLAFAFYIGEGTWANKAVRRVTKSPYSHVELVIDGVCWSSSVRDGGVRSKRINLQSGNWVVLTLPDGEATDALADAALAWFKAHEGERYDYLGVARFVIPFIPAVPWWWFCSEAVVASVGVPNAHKWSPGDVHGMVLEMVGDAGRS